MWTKYAVLTQDPLIAAGSLTGLVTQSIYMLWYYVYTRDKVSHTSESSDGRGVGTDGRGGLMAGVMAGWG